MSDDDIIDAVNRRAAADADFRRRLNTAVENQNGSLLRTLILDAIRGIFHGVTNWLIEQAKKWFFGS